MSEKSIAEAGSDDRRAATETLRKPARRRFIAAAATAGASALALPRIAGAAEPITLKFQTTWKVDDIFIRVRPRLRPPVNTLSVAPQLAQESSPRP